MEALLNNYLTKQQASQELCNFSTHPIHVTESLYGSLLYVTVSTTPGTKHMLTQELFKYENLGYAVKDLYYNAQDQFLKAIFKTSAK